MAAWPAIVGGRHTRLPTGDAVIHKQQPAVRGRAEDGKS